MYPDAAGVRGITLDELANAPFGSDVHDTVAAFLAGRRVIAHNDNFDSRLLA